MPQDCKTKHRDITLWKTLFRILMYRYSIYIDGIYRRIYELWSTQSSTFTRKSIVLHNWLLELLALTNFSLVYVINMNYYCFVKYCSLFNYIKNIKRYFKQEISQLFFIEINVLFTTQVLIKVIKQRFKKISVFIIKYFLPSKNSGHTC